MIRLLIRKIALAKFKRRASSIGRGTTIDKTVQLHPGEAQIKIGCNCFIAQGCIFSIRKAGLVIGDSVMIGPRCMLFDWTHLIDPKSIDLRENANQLISNGPVTIVKGVWIEAGSIILSGVEISEGAVVGAGSVVTKSVPPYSVVAGNPAKLIRHRLAT